MTMQLVFVLDSSEGVTAKDYRKEKDFIKKLVRTLNVYPGGSEVGLIAYSDKPSIVVKLKGGQTLASFDAAVDQLPQLRLSDFHQFMLSFFGDHLMLFQCFMFTLIPTL